MRWWGILLIIFLIIIGIIGAAVFYFYNQYSEEIGMLSGARTEANALFKQGVRGPNNCSDFLGCINYCKSNSDACVSFCEENPENKLCGLALSSLSPLNTDELNSI